MLHEPCPYPCLERSGSAAKLIANLTGRYAVFLARVRLPHCIVGITNSEPSFTPDGQREVTVLVLV
jgi:hypothetical protein